MSTKSTFLRKVGSFVNMGLLKPQHRIQQLSILAYAISIFIAILNNKSSDRNIMFTALSSAFMIIILHYWGLSCALSETPCHIFSKVHFAVFALPLIVTIIGLLFGEQISNLFNAYIKVVQEKNSSATIEQAKKEQ